MTTVIQQLRRQRFSLALSSGFFGFYHHAGVLKALAELSITPSGICGTSAGAIVAALYAAGMPPDDICGALLTITRRDFWDIQFPFTRTGFGWLRGERFTAVLARMLPIHHFEGCRIPLHLGVFRIRDGRSVYVSSGSLIDGVRASCAVPYLFAPVDIDGDLLWDGGLQEKTPLGPLVTDDRFDAVLISWMPPREDRNGPRKPVSETRSLLSGLSFFADTPPEERRERDRVAVQVLRDHNKAVSVLSPSRIWLGPFSLHRAKEAMNHGYTETLRILQANDPALLRYPDTE